MRIASESAQFAMQEVKLGTVRGWGGTAGFPELVGTGRARQMIVSGEPIAAATAERWGLINEIVPGDQLVERVEELARRIAANAPIAVQTAKQLLAGGNAVTLESIAAATNAFTKDAAEGLAAFREKRSPNFQGL